MRLSPKKQHSYIKKRVYSRSLLLPKLVSSSGALSSSRSVTQLFSFLPFSCSNMPADMYSKFLCSGLGVKFVKWRMITESHKWGLTSTLKFWSMKLNFGIKSWSIGAETLRSHSSRFEARMDWNFGVNWFYRW